MSSLSEVCIVRGAFTGKDCIRVCYWSLGKRLRGPTVDSNYQVIQEYLS
jgi:hypothetical protein